MEGLVFIFIGFLTFPVLWFIVRELWKALTMENTNYSINFKRKDCHVEEFLGEKTQLDESCHGCAMSGCISDKY